MSQDQIDAIIARLDSDPGFAQAMSSALTTGDAVAVAASHGFTISADDLTVALLERELSDADLENVAGGSSELSAQAGSCDGCCY
jgi:predicted ribosomally synthesized peptide with nif11-like leader